MLYYISMNELLRALGLMFAIDECNIKCQEEQFVLRDMSNNIGNIIPYNSPFVHWHYVTEFGQQLIKYQYAQRQQQQAQLYQQYQQMAVQNGYIGTPVQTGGYALTANQSTISQGQYAASQQHQMNQAVGQMQSRFNQAIYQQPISNIYIEPAVKLEPRKSLLERIKEWIPK